MKASIRLLVVSAISIFALVPESRTAEEESGPETLTAGLNGSGKPCTITRRVAAKDGDNTFHQVIVSDADGRILWRSPDVRDTDHAFAFGEFDFGSSLPEFAGDLDRDGTVKMLVPAPQSDVSPTFFRVFRWNGSAFEPQFSRAITGQARKGALLSWTGNPRNGDYWVQRWHGASVDGGWIVDLVALTKDNQIFMGTAVLVPKKGKFQLLRWIHTPLKLSTAAEPKPVESGAAANSYRARLSALDHVNSSGGELKRISDILRQDRANVHRSTHRDPEDQVDGRFAEAAQREALATMRVRVIGGATAVNRIVNGAPVVKVTINGDEVRVEIVSD